MTSRTAISLFCLIALSGCGGGDGGSPAPTAAQIQSLTGLAAPAEMPNDQSARAPAILSRADSLILSTIYGETTHTALPTFRIRARCSGTRCAVLEPQSGYSETIDLSDLEFVEGVTQALGTRYGITPMWTTARHMGADVSSLGAWMDHSAFAAQTEQVTVEGTTISVWYGQAGGDLTGSRPSGSATWLGIMTGTPVAGSDKGDRLMGTAALNLDLSHGHALDIAFSGIKNLDRERAHITETVMFTDVPIGGRGTFEVGLAGNRIQGGFYGPDHAEAAGVFEQFNIVGAFGAQKQ